MILVAHEQIDQSVEASPLLVLLELSRRARQAKNADELGFLLVNGTHMLLPYRQASIWLEGEGSVRALSGVVKPEENAPYVQWLSKLMVAVTAKPLESPVIDIQQLPEEIQADWDEWLPAYAITLPLEIEAGGLFLMAREIAFSENELALLQEWLSIWQHAWRAMKYVRKPNSFASRGAFMRWLRGNPNLPWYQRKRFVIPAALLIVMLWPVRLTVLAPGELVPGHPEVIRAPIEGVISQFHVQPNQTVKKGQRLFDFDEALLQSRVQVAAETLETARAQYRQTTQLALIDPKYRPELANLAGTIEQHRSEYVYLKGQLGRTQINASVDGVVLFDDPSIWQGRPVAVGERVMRIAQPQDVEVEVWLPIADAIPIKEGSEVRLFLQANPLSPVHAKLRYVSHDAVQRPDGAYAYRVRATLSEKTSHRVGLKGTARLGSERTTLIYWLLRRPFALVRTLLGI